LFCTKWHWGRFFSDYFCFPVGRVDRPVAIATGYRLDGSGIEFRWGQDFSAPVQTSPGAYPASCTIATGSFPGVKSGRGVMLTPSPPSSTVVKKEWSYTSTPLMGRTACTEPYYLYKGCTLPLLLPYVNLRQQIQVSLVTVLQSKLHTHSIMQSAVFTEAS
jgi:hypothetical protein